jgi:hypothetical protein
MTDDDLWKAIEALAKKQEPAIQQAILAAFAALRQVVDTETLAAAVAQGPSAVLALLPDAAFVAAFQALPKSLHGAAAAVGGMEAKGLVAMLQEALQRVAPGTISPAVNAASSWSPKIMQFQFDSLNPQVTEAVRRQAADLVVQITQQTKDAIKEEVRLGMLRGENPRETARAIRQTIGLTAQQQQAVANFRQELMTFHEREKAGAWNLGGSISRAPGGAQTYAIGPDGKPLDQITARRLRDFRYDSVLQSAMNTGKPLTQAQIDKMVAAYQRKYLRHRSEVIARTESLRAANIGAHQTWRQAIDQKLIQEHWLKRFWILGRDERTCLTCRGVRNANQEGRAFDEPFITPSGERIRFPPLHPNCRCMIVVKAVA